MSYTDDEEETNQRLVKDETLNITTTRVSFLNDFSIGADNNRFIAIDASNQSFYFAHSSQKFYAVSSTDYSQSHFRVTVPGLTQQIRINGSYVNVNTVDLYVEFRQAKPFTLFIMKICSIGYDSLREEEDPSSAPIFVDKSDLRNWPQNPIVLNASSSMNGGPVSTMNALGQASSTMTASQNPCFTVGGQVPGSTSTMTTGQDSTMNGRSVFQIHNLIGSTMTDDLDRTLPRNGGQGQASSMNGGQVQASTMNGGQGSTSSMNGGQGSTSSMTARQGQTSSTINGGQDQNTMHAQKMAQLFAIRQHLQELSYGNSSQGLSNGHHPHQGLPNGHQNPPQGLPNGYQPFLPVFPNGHQPFPQGLLNGNPPQGLSNGHQNPPQGLPNGHQNPPQGLPNGHQNPPQGLPNRFQPFPQGLPNRFQPFPQGLPNRFQPFPQGHPNRFQPFPQGLPNRFQPFPQGHPNGHQNPPQGLPNGHQNPPQGLPNGHQNPPQGSPFSPIPFQGYPFFLNRQQNSQDFLNLPQQFQNSLNLQNPPTLPNPQQQSFPSSFLNNRQQNPGNRQH